MIANRKNNAMLTHLMPGLAGTGNKAANLNLTQPISDTTNQGPVESVAQDLNIAMATAPTSQEAL